MDIKVNQIVKCKTVTNGFTVGNEYTVIEVDSRTVKRAGVELKKRVKYFIILNDRNEKNAFPFVILKNRFTIV